MFVKLKWVNRNLIPVTTKIYRNETIVANDQLANPLATLDGAVLTYQDNTVVRRKTYYYTFETINTGGQKVYSNPLKVYVEYNNGPGPRDLIWGDTQFGYFGTLTSMEFFSPADLGAFTPAITYNPPTNPIPLWNKWIRRGKICYTPQGFCNALITYQSLYANGLHFGTDDNGPWQPNGIAPVNQRRVIEKGFDKFIVRLPTATDDRNNPTFTVAAGSPDSVRRYSEVADFFYPGLTTVVCPSQRSPKLAAAVNPNVVNGGREMATATRLGTTGFVRGIFVGSTTPGSEYEKLGAVNGWTTGCSWLPVLELIPENGITVGV